MPLWSRKHGWKVSNDVSQAGCEENFFAFLANVTEKLQEASRIILITELRQRELMRIETRSNAKYLFRKNKIREKTYFISLGDEIKILSHPLICNLENGEAFERLYWKYQAHPRSDNSWIQIFKLSSNSHSISMREIKWRGGVSRYAKQRKKYCNEKIGLCFLYSEWLFSPATVRIVKEGRRGIS